MWFSSEIWKAIGILYAGGFGSCGGLQATQRLRLREEGSWGGVKGAFFF